jgi:hypothetical protein
MSSTDLMVRLAEDEVDGVGLLDLDGDELHRRSGFHASST